MGSVPNTSVPRVLLFSSLYPSEAQPHAGLFIRERMMQVRPAIDAVVVSPQPWFPFQSLIRIFRPDYRPRRAHREVQNGVEVFYPRFLSLPGFGRRLDGLMMALGSWRTVRAVMASSPSDLIDAHFAYPDGYAASLLARWLKLPFVVTLRGTEPRLVRQSSIRRRVLLTLNRAARVVVVANSLRDAVVEAGADAGKIERVGNGVDAQRFRPIDRLAARRQLDIADDATVIVSVGGLVPRKGFHRVLDIMPELRLTHPGILYLVIGGKSPEGDYEDELREQAARLDLEDSVRFLGALSPDDLHVPLSAANLFVLSTQNEGWANVFLEAMACGLPVLTTRVGGNPEVVESPELGRLVPFGDGEALLREARVLLSDPLDAAPIRAHAEKNDWSTRVASLLDIYQRAMESQK